MLSRMMRQTILLGAVVAAAVPTSVRSAEFEGVEVVTFVSEESTPVAAPQEDGVCRVGQCGPTLGCRDLQSHQMASPVCDPRMGYQSGSCPSFSTSGLYPSAECYAGKPYTFGDLACDMRATKASWGINDSCNSSFGPGSALHNWWCQEKYKMHCRNAYRNQALGAHLHNKLNYFVPSGNGGEGVPLVGFYRRVYATSPGYYDARDKQIYAAQGTGVPTVIPVAPGVRYQYNYGQGIPSSRVTPISTISPPRY